MSTDIPSYRHTGLSSQEVECSRAEHGENLLTPPPRPSLWRLYLEKLEDPVVKVLLVAALCSLGIAVVENDYVETIGIVAAILLATGIGFYFEYDAGKKFDLLNAVSEESPVKVLRNGEVSEIPRREVVVGDVVLLETGDEVPADGLLTESLAMQLNESSLTGEPVVSKTIHPEHFDQNATYPSNRVLRGTTVVNGHGRMCVELVGDATEIGKVARQSMERNEESTPLNRQLTRLANLIGKVGFTVAALAFLILFIKDVCLGYDFTTFHTLADWLPALNDTLKLFMMAVTLVVVAVPEGLPMSITLSLALNMRRMLTTNNLVRKMHACETMGAVTVICTDKTGTLTQNQMQVQHTCFPAGQHPHWMALMAEGVSVNSTAFLHTPSHAAGADAQCHNQGVGNPTELALLGWLQGQGFDYLALRQAAEVIDQLPFSTERKYMATLVHSSCLPGRKLLYVKGAPEVVMRHCSKAVDATGKVVEPTAEMAQMEHQLLQYQQQAMRTLAFAYKEIDEAMETSSLTCESQFTDLVLCGVVAISDPIRPEVPAAVARCREAGIEVKIVTGDTPGTALEIARQIGLWTNDDSERQLITGVEFAALTDEEALERVKELKVMSRARPDDKQRLVQLLQQGGAVVAVTGDGTNDAPALNHAQVGLSMGSGTSVAKEASDITLLDDSFRSIGTAVMWGRSLYKNIQRFILFQLTINFVALFIVLVGSLVGTELPLTVTQMLWVNLIMDSFAALALASIPPCEEVMKERPRKHSDFIINPAMQWRIMGVGLLFALLLFGMLLYFQFTEGGLTIHRLTLFFTTFVLLQFWNLFNAKAFGSTQSAFSGLRRSYGMEMIALAILLGQFLIVEWGGDVFRTEPLSWIEWAILLGATSLVLWVGELWRYLQRLRHRAW